MLAIKFNQWYPLSRQSQIQVRFHRLYVLCSNQIPHQSGLLVAAQKVRRDENLFTGKLTRFPRVE